VTGILLYADSIRDANIYYATHFLAPDPFIYVRGDGHEVLIVSALEAERARKESRILDVRSFDDLGYQDYLNETNDRIQATVRVMVRILRELDVNPCTVAPTFPVIFADMLRTLGFTVVADANLFVEERRRKSPEEIAAISAAVTRAERALATALDILAEAEEYNGTLLYRGIPLTAERLRAELEVDLIRDDYISETMIVAPGRSSADPHWLGSGPIRPHEPLILDLYPQNRQTRYHGDVTRTIVKGVPSDTVRRMYEAVLKAQQVALSLIRPGVNGREVHEAVEASFRADGFTNGGQGPQFIHGTGHGLGLEVHEFPPLGKIDIELAESDVVTVEPGLYDPAVGGVRLEDVVVVTSDGNRVLSSLRKELVV
jgi:Xaa-Pro aminopeptidase